MNKECKLEKHLLGKANTVLQLNTADFHLAYKTRAHNPLRHCQHAICQTLSAARLAIFGNPSVIIHHCCPAEMVDR